jgi:hypothetical protein
VIPDVTADASHPPPPHPRNPQIARIARLLAIDPSQVLGLDDVPEAALRELHDQISEAYFGPGRDQFARVAGLSKVLPGAIAGKLAERFLPPQLAARAAEMLEPARARDLVGRVSVGYLADLAVALDPTRSEPVMAVVPPDRVAEVAAEMFLRGEYEAMAELAGAVSAEGLFAALAVASPHDLLELVPLLDWDEVMEQVVDATPTPQLDGVLDEIAGARRWSIGNCLIDRLSAVSFRRTVVRLAHAPTTTFERFCTAAREGLLDAAADRLVHEARVVRTAAERAEGA